MTIINAAFASISDFEIPGFSGMEPWTKSTRTQFTIFGSFCKQNSRRTFIQSK